VVTITISIPDELQEQLLSTQDVDWSAVARAAFESKLKELDTEVRRKKAHKAGKRRQARPVSAEDLSEVSYNRSLLLDRITGQAEWRDEKAKQYPDDERNAQSAESLRQLAQHLSNIPVSDPLWLRYHRAWDQLADDDGDALHSANELENDELRNYGFYDFSIDVSPEDALQFLTSHVETLEDILAEKGS
jgi:hypothetical protein